MELHDPIVAYIADNNVEAAQVAHLLCLNDIDAHAEEDESVVGLWAFGRLPQVHKPRVWISQTDSPRAAELLAEYESTKIARLKAHPSGGQDNVHVVCEECGKTSVFAGKLAGTVQECRHCRSHVDVGDFDWPHEDPESFDVEEA